MSDGDEDDEDVPLWEQESDIDSGDLSEEDRRQYEEYRKRRRLEAEDAEDAEAGSLAALERRWLSDDVRTVDVIHREYGVDIDTARAVSTESFETLRVRLLQHAAEIGRADQSMLMLGSHTQASERTIESLYGMVFEAYHMAVSGLIRSACARGDVNTTSCTPSEYIMHYATPTVQPTKEMVVVSYFLDLLARGGYRRKGDILYTPIKIDGHETRSYEKWGTITEFMYANCNERLNERVYRLFLKRGMESFLANHLSRCEDSRLRDYKPHRYLHGFENGIYDVMHDEAYFYNDANGLLPSEACITHHKGLRLDPGWFTDEGRRREIPVRSWVRVMETQRWDADTCEVFQAVCGGRLLYRLSDVDRWSVMPMLSGLANSGKSTVLETLTKLMYASDQVGILPGSGQERVFGLQSMVGKLLVVCDELEPGSDFDPGKFKIMAAGGVMSVAVKHKSPAEFFWDTPVLTASNSLTPDWRDPSGAIVRRVCPFRFEFTPTEIDGTLGDQMYADGAAWIVAGNRKYRALVARDPANFEAIASAQIMAGRELAREDVDPVVAFLESDDVYLGAGEYVPMNVFRDRFKDWCRDNNVEMKQRWKEDLYKSTFTRYSISTTARKTMEYPKSSGTMVRGKFFVGVDYRISQIDYQQ